MLQVDLIGWVGPALAAGFLAVAAVAATATRRARRLAARAAALEARLATLATDVQALCATQAGAGDRLLDAEKEIRRTAERLGRLELGATGPGDYRHAIALAARGATSDDLVADCGLERAEAELVALMYREGLRPGGTPARE